MLDLVAIQGFAGTVMQTMGAALHGSSVPVAIKIGSTQYNAVGITAKTGPIQTAPDPKGGGTLRYQAIEVYILRSLMATRPGKDDLIVFGGVEFSKIEVEDDGSVGILWHLRAVRFPK